MSCLECQAEIEPGQGYYFCKRCNDKHERMAEKRWATAPTRCMYCGHVVVSVHHVTTNSLQCSKCERYTPVDVAMESA